MTEVFVESTLDSPSGARLHLYTAMPDKPLRGVVHVNHGMAEHAGRYGRFARALNDAGFGVVAHDHRGHGQTVAPDAPRGVFAHERGFDKVIEDVLAVNLHIRATMPGKPIAVFGHSMGAVIALVFALSYPDRVNALACWNAGVETGAKVRLSRLILLAEAALRGRGHISVLARKLTFDGWNRQFRPNRTAFDWLSRDEAEVDAYVADPDCGFDVSTGLWLDLLDGMFRGGDDRRLDVLAHDLPVHLLGGGADPCSNFGRDMRHLADRLKKKGLLDVSCSILPDTRHESLNEINRDETTRNFIHWLSGRLR